MTAQEEYELSCYEELTKVKENKSVYLVRHMETGRICIKKNIEIYNEAIYFKLKDMKCRGIPQIHFCARADGKLIVIEDYIQGRSLQEIYESEGVFSEQRVTDMMCQLCDIVQQLHGCTPQIIHRDIKPSNIMLSDDGVVKLIDFNAAKEFTEGKTEDTRYIGTQDFAAPEQYGFGQSDGRTDIYEIGVTMNYLLTGVTPKEGLYEGALGRVIGKCTKLDAADRYQTVTDLKAALTGKSKNTVRENDREGKEQKGHPFLPVGFRSGKIWKMVAAVFGYWFLIYVCMGMTVTDHDGRALQGGALWVNRCGALLLFLGYLYYIGNYLNIRTGMTAFVRNRVLRFLLHIFYLLLYSFVVLMLIVILE